MRKKAASIFKIASNKYLIAVIGFAFIMLFFDDNNVFVQLDRRRQLDDLITSKTFYEGEILKTQQTLTNLQSSPAAVEKFAREYFMMKRDNEDVFVVDQQATGTAIKKK